MALLQGSFFSDALCQNTHFMAYLPFDKGKKRRKPALLVLLHGLMDNCNAWVTGTRILSLAEALGVTVFFPEGHRSFYCDMAFGGRYHTYVTEELPRLLPRLLPLNIDWEETVIGGNSMGGYGALKACLDRNSPFKRCMAFSPVIEPLKAFQQIPVDYLVPGEEKAIFGLKGLVPPGEDLYALLEERQKIGLPMPQISITCGREDFLVGQNRDFQKHLAASGIPCRYREAFGEHGWEYWNENLAELFKEFFEEVDR